MTLFTRSARALATLASVFAACLLLGCASDSETAELNFAGNVWNPDAVSKGCAMSGVQAKKLESSDPTCESYMAAGVRIDCLKQSDGKTKVLLSADDPDAKKLLPAIANNIAMSAVPRDKVRSIKAKVRR